MAESPERFKSYIGRSETVTDVVTASMVARGSFTLAGLPTADGDGATLWARDADGQLAMLASAKFA